MKYLYIVCAVLLTSMAFAAESSCYTDSYGYKTCSDLSTSSSISDDDISSSIDNDDISSSIDEDHISSSINEDDEDTSLIDTSTEEIELGVDIDTSIDVDVW